MIGRAIISVLARDSSISEGRKFSGTSCIDNNRIRGKIRRFSIEKLAIFPLEQEAKSPEIPRRKVCSLVSESGKRSQEVAEK